MTRACGFGPLRPDSFAMRPQVSWGKTPIDVDPNFVNDFDLSPEL